MPSTLCIRLLGARAKAELTQQQCADAIGISKARYQHYETGRREPDVEMLIALATLFHVSIDYLVGMIDPEE